MNTVAIKFKTYASNVNIVNNDNLAKRTLYFMFASMGVLALVYLIVLSNMVFNIVERRALESQARALSNEVSNLELSYLSLTNKVDLNLSHSMGFKEIKPQFATRKSLGSIKLAKNDL